MPPACHELYASPQPDREQSRMAPQHRYATLIAEATTTDGAESMKKILIVDDKPEVRELVSVTLEIGPYQILTASNGSQAIELARQEHPDLMLLDVMMPGGGPDGFEVCRRLKSDPSTRDITIIMLTSKGQERDRELGYQAGADDYFVKPFSPLELIAKVEEVLEA